MSRQYVREIAATLGAAFEGDGDLEISAAAPIESAGPFEISFIGNRKAFSQAGLSRAGCLIVPEGFPNPAGRTVIRSAEPRNAFAAVVARLHPKTPPPPGIHPTAVVSPGARIAPGCSVGPYAVIEEGASLGSGCVLGAGCILGAGVTLGDGCLLYANVTIYAGVEVGARAVLHSGCVLGADGFGFVLTPAGYEKFPQVGRVSIGNDVEIGANSCVDRAALGVTSIGDGTKLDNMVHIGHNCQIGRHVVIAAQTGISGAVVVEDYVVIGGQVGIGDKARIETRAVVGSGSGILTSKIVRSGEVVWGTPARPLKKYLRQLAAISRIEEVRQELAELRKRIKS
ncbi:MAG: UDP-3-O-(3-hydroxymyristoyl)glucosamine N-acyltransferase [Bryobacteraceae bacterium]